MGISFSFRPRSCLWELKPYVLKRTEKSNVNIVILSYNFVLHNIQTPKYCITILLPCVLYGTMPGKHCRCGCFIRQLSQGASFKSPVLSIRVQASAHMWLTVMPICRYSDLRNISPFSVLHNVIVEKRRSGFRLTSGLLDREYLDKLIWTRLPVPRVIWLVIKNTCRLALKLVQ